MTVPYVHSGYERGSAEPVVRFFPHPMKSAFWMRMPMGRAA